MIVQEPIRCSKRQTNRRSWEHLNDDDSTYLPSVRTENYSVDTDTNSTIVVMRQLLDPEVLREAIEELDKKISSISLPTSKHTLRKLYKTAIKSKTIEYSNSLHRTIFSLLKALHLPKDSSIDLQKLLISTLTKRTDTNQYATRNATKTNSTGSRGKEITSITNIRQQFIKLTQKCEFIEDNSKENNTTTNSVPIVENTTNEENDIILDAESSRTNNIEGESLSIITGAENNDKLTDEVLTLPRKY